MKLTILCLSSALLVVGLASAQATPPALINYQGVLRDASDMPLDGDHEMVFRFYDADPGGNLLFTDSHTGGAAVSVTGGLFNVRIGEGAPGAGVYGSLAEMFAHEAEVYLEVQVGSDSPMTPRVRVASSAYTLNSARLGGRSPNYFLDTSSDTQSKTGGLIVDNSEPASFGIMGYGSEGGAHFKDSDGSGYAHLGYGHTGIEAFGSARGGYFKDLNQTGYANVGTGDRGIEAFGDEMGGRFSAWPGTVTYVAFEDIGIWTQGNHAGGIFNDADQSGRAYLGYGDVGIQAEGNAQGGYFQDLNGTGYARVGYGDLGIFASGDSDGGQFVAGASGGWGVEAFGQERGGYFLGNTAGGSFENLSSGAVCHVAWGAYKLWCSAGAVSFVQNRPHERDQVIVYGAPEGDEVATYTRGTSHLEGGLARVSLGETFQWVTNPDIGLTVYLTPRGECRGLYVESLSSEEIVVREQDGGTGDVVFDYMVFGLRIGFEELPVIQEKTEGEAYIPSIDQHLSLYERRPELRRYNALERFKRMQSKEGESAALDLSASRALQEAIGVFDPAVHGERTPTIRGHERPRRTGSAEEQAPPSPSGEDPTESPAPVRAPESVPSETDFANSVWVAEPVEVGDVLVIDPERPGLMKRARIPSDSAVFGIVTAGFDVEDGSGPREPSWSDGSTEIDPPEVRASVVLSGMVACKVDAAFGSIRPGDLLTTSPTPGHAMVAYEPQPGTILGKALEPLEVGTGLIKVLVTLR